MISPAALMRLKNGFSVFRGNHPKLIQYFKVMSGKVSEGTVVEINVELPDGSKSRANVKLNAQDIAFLREIIGTVSEEKRS